MEIQLKEVTIAELYDGYEYDELSDILGYGGKLNIRQLTSANTSTNQNRSKKSSVL